MKIKKLINDEITVEEFVKNGEVQYLSTLKLHNLTNIQMERKSQEIVIDLDMITDFYELMSDETIDTSTENRMSYHVRRLVKKHIKGFNSDKTKLIKSAIGFAIDSDVEISDNEVDSELYYYNRVYEDILSTSWSKRILRLDKERDEFLKQNHIDTNLNNN